MIKEKEYKQRRDSFVKKLSQNSLALLSSATYKIRSNDTEFPYRQESNIYYLSGFKEDNSSLVFLKIKKKTKVILFVQKKDKEKELWTGQRLGEKRAKKQFLVDAVFSSDTLEKKLLEYAKKIDTLYYDFSSDTQYLRKLQKLPYIHTHKNLATIVGQLRLIKSQNEIKLMKKALEITKEAHHKAMAFQKEKRNEYELLAEIEYTFKKNGAYSDAYTSIVAGGNGANTLHYISNDQELKKDELILIDAGCEYEYYASDITRTIPVSAQFTQAQKELYQLVLDVQLEIIEMIKPNVKRTKLQEKAVKLLTQGMVSLNILKGDVKELIKKEAYKEYYPHGIGHWIGIDVHDASPYKDAKGKEIKLQKGMVLTIEPGLYINKDDESVPAKYRGIGIRIEDDILVTKDGYENLSSSIAKSIDEIESLAN